MTDDTTTNSDAADDRRTDNDTAFGGATEDIDALEAEANDLRERLGKLEAVLDEMRDDADSGSASGPTQAETPDSEPAPMEAAEPNEMPKLVTSGGSPTKVIGKIPDDGGIGVMGEATGDDSYGVLGTTEGGTLSYGVRGEAGSENSDGVHGVTTADGNNTIFSSPSAGVTGIAKDAGNPTDTAGVYAQNLNNETDGQAVLALAGDPLGTYDASETHAVDAFTYSTGDSSAGVRAIATGSSGTTYGIDANTSSEDAGAAAVRATTPDTGDAVAVEANDHIETSGHVDAGKGFRGAVGGSVYLSTNWDIPDTSGGTKVPFDSVIADQRDEFETGDGDHYFECAYDGTYVLTLGIESVDTTTGKIRVELNIVAGSASSSPAADQAIRYDFDPGGDSFARMFTKTIFGLKAGNRLHFELRDTAGNATLTAGADETFFEVRQVGGGGKYTSSPQTTNAVTSSEENPEGG